MFIRHAVSPFYISLLVLPPAGLNRYHRLDIDKSLRDNLMYKVVIEYPVLHVVLRDHWEEYPSKGPGKENYPDLHHCAFSSLLPVEICSPSPRFHQDCVTSCFLQRPLLNCFFSPYFSLWQHATPTETSVFCTASRTPARAKKRIKHGLVLSGDLMTCGMTQFEKTGGPFDSSRRFVRRATRWPLDPKLLSFGFFFSLV